MARLESFEGRDSSLIQHALRKGLRACHPNIKFGQCTKSGPIEKLTDDAIIRKGDWMTSDLHTASWGGEVAAAAQMATTYSIGLMSGSRFANDRRLIDRLVKSAALELAESTGASTLLLRLDNAAREPDSTKSRAAVPVASKSPLGPWYEISFPMPQSKSAPWALEHIPQWMPQWKLRHRLLVIDLGPMHLTPSRVIGRLCDMCYLMLGPSTCASHDWIMQQIDFHSRSGTIIAGSVVATTSAA